MPRIKLAVGYTTVFLSLAMIFIALGSFAIFVIVGAWDLLAWLTNAQWKTTHFVVPYFAISAFALACIISRLLGSILDWAERGQKYW